VTTHLYKNSGLEAVEREIVRYAKRYALYNKCYQASAYLQAAMDKCVDNIEEAEQKLNSALDEAKNHFDKKKNELCVRLEDKKKDITTYNTEFQKMMQDNFKKYTEAHHIVEGDMDAQKSIRDELHEMWKKYKEEEKGDKSRKENGWALSWIQIYAERYYNDLLEQFSTSANSDIIAFWDKKSRLFKTECISIVHDSSVLTDEQKRILEAVVLSKNNMDTCRMDFNLRKMKAIRKKKFLFWDLKAEKFDARACVLNIVDKFNDSVSKRINSNEINNEKNFKKWTDDLISKLIEELCKFNKDLDNIGKKISEYKSEIDTKNECRNMLEENQQYIKGLLDIQGGEKDE
jgi:hypothetical protein